MIYRQHLVGRIAADRQPDRLGADCDHQLGIVKCARAGADCFAGSVDTVDPRTGHDMGADLLRHLRCALRHELLGKLALRKRIGQHRLGVETAIIGGDDDQRSDLVELAEFACHRVAGESGADDDDRFHECPCEVK